MIGNGMSKVLRYAVIAAVVLVVGTQILTSVIDQVALLRTGDVSSLVPVIALAVFFMLLARPKETKTPLLVLINFLAWSTTGYLVVVSFVFFLPFGIAPAIVSAGITVALFELLRGSANNQGIVRSICMFFAPYFPTLVRRISSKATANARISDKVSMRIVPHDLSPKIIGLIQTRPMLPIALTHFFEFDILKTDVRRGPITAFQVSRLLESFGISRLKRASDQFTRDLLNVPVIGEFMGHPMQDYRIIHDELTLERILPDWPIGATLFSDGNKPVLTVKSTDIVGYNSTPIPKGLEPWVLVNQDLSVVALKGV